MPLTDSTLEDASVLAHKTGKSLAVSTRWQELMSPSMAAKRGSRPFPWAGHGALCLEAVCAGN